ncbi:MAG: transglycosylase SLT domain-containing protein [Victivallaceae bacterium]|nr:transglycosylase SLT domain-containing protein [Victivallaceae bacterium]
MSRNSWKHLELRITAASLALLAMAMVFLHYSEELIDVWIDDGRYNVLIEQAALRNGVEPALIKAVIFQESKFRPDVRGSQGEIGLMQILPGGAVADYARVHRSAQPPDRELFDPARNIEIGSWYLGRALRRWKKYRCVRELALCQYNAGESRADRWKPQDPAGNVVQNIDIASTSRYVTNVMRRYEHYRKKQKTAPDAVATTKKSSRP